MTSFINAIGDAVRESTAETRTDVTMGGMVADERRLTEFFDALELVDSVINGGVDHTARVPAALEQVLTGVKRALVNPGSRDAKALLRAIARLEAVRHPVPADPEADK